MKAEIPTVDISKTRRLTPKQSEIKGKMRIFDFSGEPSLFVSDMRVTGSANNEVFYLLSPLTEPAVKPTAILEHDGWCQ